MSQSAKTPNQPAPRPAGALSQPLQQDVDWPPRPRIEASDLRVRRARYERSHSTILSRQQHYSGCLEGSGHELFEKSYDGKGFVRPAEV
jgi:hypothetical protein